MKKIKISKKTLIFVLTGSLLFNFLVLYIDTFSYLWPRIEREYFEKENNILQVENPENQIISKSLDMASSSKVTMIWNEKGSFTEEVLKYISHNSQQYKHHYPRAFLLSGLTDFAKSTNDTILMLKIARVFDEYIDKEGLPSFTFDKVDQVPFGIAAINLYKYSNDLRYKKFAEYIYAQINLWVSKEYDVILYRQGKILQYYDVLGMICPFLMRYNVLNPQSNAIMLANQQLEYYKKYGVDKETYLPTHGINLETNIKVGPTNWGRGIGWYIIALSEYDYHNKQLSVELKELINTINKLKMKGNVWSQFPGSVENFDASTTTMFMYAINITYPGTYSKKDIIDLLGVYITKEGFITQTSGDTYGLNNYSNSFGLSELSQGMLLMLLSTAYN